VRAILPYVGIALLVFLAIRILPLFVRPPIVLAVLVAVGAAVLALKLRRR